MSAIATSPTERGTTIVATFGGADTAGAAVAFVQHDPMIEERINFVPGLEAHPDRESDPEPAGSGPFGF